VFCQEDGSLLTRDMIKRVLPRVPRREERESEVMMLPPGRAHQTCTTPTRWQTTSIRGN
jgi:hypothetical protein